MDRLSLIALVFALAAAQAPAQVAPPVTLTVMTYNIRAGLGPPAPGQRPDVVANLDRVASVVREAGADVVLLQEVDRGVERSARVDEAASLAERLGMDHVFAPALEIGGGDYGVALLTTWDIASHEVIRLFRPDYTRTYPGRPEHFSEQRVALVAQIASGDAQVTVVNTHLGLTADQRRRQLLQIAAVIDALGEETPVVFGGDLNCEPDAPELLPIRQRLGDCYQEVLSPQGEIARLPIAERLTFPSDKPDRCIDYLFVRGIDAVRETAVLDAQASDHRPVITRLAISRPSPPAEP